MATVQLPPVGLTSYDSHYPYVVSASGYTGTYYPWNAVNKVTTDSWYHQGVLSSWFKLDLGKERLVSGFYFKGYSNSTQTWNMNVVLEGSLDDLNWYQLDSFGTGTSVYDATRTLSSPSSARYLRFTLTTTSTSYNKWIQETWFICDAPELESQPDSEYYVRQDYGNDNNDGLSPETAWATIDKAVNEIANYGNSLITIHVAPGTYRESLYIDRNDFSTNKTTVVRGDPDCLIFTDCIPGTVTISGFSSDDQTPGQQKRALGEVYTIISTHPVVLENVEIHTPFGGTFGCNPVNSKIWAGLYGVMKFSLAKNCEVYSNAEGFYGISSSDSKAYNCICFSNKSTFYLSSCYHCFGIGLIGFNTCVSYNCAAQYSPTGFSSGSCYNCIASNCQNGFTSTSGSNRKSIGCAANTGDSISSAFYFLPEIKTLVSKGLIDKGAPVVDNPTDILGLDRNTSNGLPDIGPIENCDYSLNYEDYYMSSPSVRINRKGQLSFSFRVNKGSAVIKQVTVKHLNTANDLKPQVIIKGLGIELIKTTEFENGSWETLTFSFVAPFDGVMEMILFARDPNEAAYSLFSDLI